MGQSWKGQIDRIAAANYTGKKAPIAPKLGRGPDPNAVRIAESARAREERQKPKYVEKQVLHLASRLTRLRNEIAPEGSGSVPNTTREAEDARRTAAEINEQLKKAVVGYSRRDLRAALDRAGVVDEATRRTLLGYRPKDGPATALVEGVGTALDLVGRPAQAGMGYIFEGGGGPVGNPLSEEAWEGAWKGLTGEKTYSPVQTAHRQFVPGSSKRDARKFEENLPGPVRFAANVGLGIGYDPLTYLSFGTTAAGKAAVSTAAPFVASLRAGETAEAAAAASRGLSAAAAAETAGPILRELSTKGLRALSKAERTAVRQTLGKGVYRKLGGAPGGVKVLGRSIPGTSIKGVTTPAKRMFWSKVDELADSTESGVRGALGRAARSTETLTRPRGSIRWGERAGTFEEGTAEIIEAELARYKGWTHKADEAAQRLLRRTHDVTDDEFRAIRDAIESGKVDDLDPRLATAAREIKGILQRSARRERKSGLMLSPEEAAARRQAGVDRQIGPAIKAGSRRATKARQRAEEAKQAAAETAALLARHREQGTVAEFGTKAYGGDSLRFDRPDIRGERIAADLQERLGREVAKARELEKAAVRAEKVVARLTARRQRLLERTKGIDPERYTPRYLTEEARAERNMAAESGRVEPGSPTAGTMAGTGNRKARQTDPDQLTSEFTTEAGDAYFDPDLRRVTLRRAGATERDVAQARFVHEVGGVKDTSGNPLILTGDDITDELRSAAKHGDAKYVERSLPVTKEGAHGGLEVVHEPVLVHRALSRDFDRIAKLMSNDAELRIFAEGYGKFMQLWKGYATVPGFFGTGFVARNLQGNALNGWLLAGARPHWGEAMSIQQRMWRGRRVGSPYKYLSVEERAAVREALDNGVLDSGFFRADLDAEHALMQNLERRGTFRDAPMVDESGKIFGKNTKGRRILRAGNPISTDNVMLRYGRRLNDAIEQNSRLAVFLAQRQKGLSAVEAGRVTRKYLFDYSDLSHADRAIKQFSPFWTWTRKNVPLQLEHLLKQPGKYSGIGHVSYAAQGEAADYAGQEVPQWMAESGGVMLPWTTGSGKPQVWVPDIPQYQGLEVLRPLTQLPRVFQGKPGALEKFANDAINTAGIGGIPGMVAAGYDVARGREGFSGRRFYPGEQVETPTYLKPFQALGLVDDTIPREWQYLAEQTFPAGSKIRGLFPTDPDDEDKQTRRILSTFTGQGIWPIGPDTARSEMSRRLEQLELETAALRNDGYEPPRFQGAKSGGSKSGGSGANWRKQIDAIASGRR